ncbi:MAG: type II toxin-antitoxin system RelE/ParE family toxin [Leptospiraceae bacterium]|nr:type II toxin-antitoxin system RelE/ParE family toxin [Leptospiraceae bacterium]
MELFFSKKFLKQLAKLPPNPRRQIEEFVFTRLSQCETIAATGKIEKMKGYPNFFKARFGVYRVGFEMSGDKLIIRTVLHRKEIYRFFP